MKINTLFCLIFNFIFSLSFSQNLEKKVEQRHFISLKYYKLKYKEPLTKEDSLNFQYRNNDTLVLIKNYLEPKGVRVPYEFKDSTFLHYYKKVAFNHKNNLYSTKTSMKYWKKDIRIFFSKSIKKSTKKDFIPFVKNISDQVDSLNIFIVKKAKDANYFIYNDGDYEYEENLKNNKNTNYYIYWKQNKIYKGAIKLYPDDISLEDKMKDYFIQSLGFFKLSNEFDCNSYFSNCASEKKTLTNLDLEIIKYHYSYGICKGTNLETFENQHKKAKELLKETGHKLNFLHVD
ncbi:hypothetical protein ACFQ1R_01660 [Mariniflexile jejuense]|uniref:YARHG domain-containing protein n=1 Tax=Mariniflexile jejuense TaxID=1173582 RepID=A0ABW3JG43_9FLAO